ncbi:hypothetical protein BCR44DRAFT_389627 [Catenaria anguillulae PL171]|uniref:Uncharacterized protein n=1 Tax=Catenaria anguillulae PL171 TaxID=765915 RepID=A0A1Y2I4M8_9FUNG|nr:hypothetical protein BCR44DRAFT_389627 [Catenaria anguillulae PL171]
MSRLRNAMHCSNLSICHYYTSACNAVPGSRSASAHPPGTTDLSSRNRTDRYANRRPSLRECIVGRRPSRKHSATNHVPASSLVPFFSTSSLRPTITRATTALLWPCTASSLSLYLPSSFPNDPTPTPQGLSAACHPVFCTGIVRLITALNFSFISLLARSTMFIHPTRILVTTVANAAHFCPCKPCETNSNIWPRLAQQLHLPSNRPRAAGALELEYPCEDGLGLRDVRCAWTCMTTQSG